MKWFIVLLVLFCAWFIISAYYYSQHRITVKNCTLDREVAVENMNTIAGVSLSIKPNT